MRRPVCWVAVAVLGSLVLPARHAAATPSFESTGSIIGSNFVFVPKAGDFFLSDFDDGTAEVSAASGFTDFPAPGPTHLWSVSDLELDEDATNTTASSTDFFYGQADGAAPEVTFDLLPGLTGTDVEVVGRLNALGYVENFDGSYRLQLEAGASQAAQDFFAELQALNPGDPGRFVFSGTIDSIVPLDFDGDPAQIFVTSTAIPVVTNETLPAGTPGANAKLLGGTGAPGGLDITFDTGAGNVDLAATFETLTASAFADQYDAVTTELGNLGIEFAGGQVQLWNLIATGDIVGDIVLTLSYDDGAFGPDFDETVLQVGHVPGSGPDAGSLDFPEILGINPVANTITVRVTNLSPFFLLAPEPSGFTLVTLGLLGLGLRQRRRAP